MRNHCEGRRLSQLLLWVGSRKFELLYEICRFWLFFFFLFNFKPGLTLSLAFGRSGILIVGSVYIMEYFINSLDWNCSLSPSLVIDVCKAHVRSCFPFNICKHLVSKCYVMEEVSSGKRLEQHKPGEGE